MRVGHGQRSDAPLHHDLRRFLHIGHGVKRDDGAGHDVFNLKVVADTVEFMPRLEDVDELFIAITDTGAYQDSFASHHCLLSSPAKLIATNGEIKVARKRETPEEIGKLFGW